MAAACLVSGWDLDFTGLWDSESMFIRLKAEVFLPIES
jgi:hypothetical protein